MTSTLLITGVAGFIGCNAAERFLRDNYKVIGLDNFDESYPKWIKELNIKKLSENNSFTFIKGDLTDHSKISSVLKRYNVNTIVHLGAKTGVRHSIENPLDYIKANVLGTSILLEECRKANVKEIIIASSSSVYGERNEVPFKETDDIHNPISPYATTKSMVESIAHTFSKLYDMKITVLRFFTVYGPKGRPDMAPYIFIHRISQSKPIIQFGDGETSRDYTFISDIVDGIFEAVRRTSSWQYEVINLGNSEPIQLSDFITEIENVVGKEANIIKEDRKEGDVSTTCADISKARRLLDYNPKIPLRKGLEQMFDWYNSLVKKYDA